MKPHGFAATGNTDTDISDLFPLDHENGSNRSSRHLRTDPVSSSASSWHPLMQAPPLPQPQPPQQPLAPHRFAAFYSGPFQDIGTVTNNEDEKTAKDSIIEDGSALPSYQLPLWMEGDLNLDSPRIEEDPFPGTCGDGDYRDQVDHRGLHHQLTVRQHPSYISPEQMTMMAKKIGEQSSELEHLRFELAQTKIQLSETESQRKQLLAKNLRLPNDIPATFAYFDQKSANLESTAPSIETSTDSLYTTEASSATTWSQSQYNGLSFEQDSPSCFATDHASSTVQQPMFKQPIINGNTAATFKLAPVATGGARTGSHFTSMSPQMNTRQSLKMDNIWSPLATTMSSTWTVPDSTFGSANADPKSSTTGASNAYSDILSNSAAITSEPTTEPEKTNEVFYAMNQYNEAINYRKLLERSVSCNWKFIVDRIVLDNDQQASIFLQQKLKIASHEQRTGIINAIIDQSYMLMINRFGNFLVQRCLEYGDSKQVASVTKGMIGNVVDLAMDPFGCHVIQKALDCVDNEMKNRIIEEMLSRVTDSVVHRYACHVWQKLFELRWDVTPPRFMDRVNRDLTGMWTEVALGETGSLVVQNIFENCNDQDKQPCVREIIDNLDRVIKGQWGNWVIQHMVEHADEPYRQTVCQRIIEASPNYSVDQFASKAVEKMLKMGDPVIIQGFLDKVTERVPGRPRIPLIDIASDAHGNYLIQYILQSGSQAQKEQVAIQIKKHMVSLRGSKWGSKCAWLIDKNSRSRKK